MCQPDHTSTVTSKWPELLEVPVCAASWNGSLTVGLCPAGRCPGIQRLRLFPINSSRLLTHLRTLGHPGQNWPENLDEACGVKDPPNPILAPPSLAFPHTKF